MASCCSCAGTSTDVKSKLPLICLVPRGEPGAAPALGAAKSSPATSAARSDFQILDDDYLKKHFKLPQRALYLDSYRRPLISFPMTQEDVTHFNLARKYKINQQILDGYLDASEAISAPSVFPYAKTPAEQRKSADEEEEIIYILQLPDLEFQCPVHKEKIKTPRFIWHSCKKSKDGKKTEMKRGGGPLNKPKPWLLSRHTDFDLLSQW